VCSGCQQSQTKTREVYMEMKTVLTRPCCRLVATTLLLYSWAGDCYRATPFRCLYCMVTWRKQQRPGIATKDANHNTPKVSSTFI